MRKGRIARAGLIFAASLLAACASVPFDYPRETTVAIEDTGETLLGREAAEWARAHDGQSGFYPLLSGHDALGVRLRLLEMAERSVDVQYFLMKDDTAGRLFAGALLAAADRGVRIRFLLDDVFTTVEDEGLEMLDRHESIDVRLYNPVARGGVMTFNFLAEFKRANRRMHNKSFTADNQVTVVGGRNIADEYFELRTDAEFIDFDIVGIGPVAADVSDEFDLYWNHQRSVPMEAFAGDISDEEFEAWRLRIDAEFENAHTTVYAPAVHTELVTHLFDGVVPLHPAPYEVVTDDPEKLVTQIDESRQTLVNHLSDIAEEAEFEVIAITPYFVPQEAGINFWRSLTERGIRVIVLTNSLASNNHTAVHSGYARHRKDIIRAGIELYEARVDAVNASVSEDAPDVLTLHTKVLVFDERKLFAGSLNLDPRSIDINAEMGIVVDSPELVADLRSAFLDDLQEFAYRVELDEDDRLIWRGHVNGEEVVETKEPQTSAWLRFKAFLLKIVPDSQL